MRLEEIGCHVLNELTRNNKKGLCVLKGVNAEELLQALGLGNDSLRKMINYFRLRCLSDMTHKIFIARRKMSFVSYESHSKTFGPTNHKNRIVCFSDLWSQDKKYLTSQKILPGKKSQLMRYYLHFLCSLYYCSSKHVLQTAD